MIAVKGGLDVVIAEAVAREVGDELVFVVVFIDALVN